MNPRFLDPVHILFLVEIKINVQEEHGLIDTARPCSFSIPDTLNNQRLETKVTGIGINDQSAFTVFDSMQRASKGFNEHGYSEILCFL